MLAPFRTAGTDWRWQSTVKRVDVSNDIAASLAADHYYEVGTGLVWESSLGFTWLRNIGLGVSFNIGSALSGGSVVLLTNVH